MGVKLAYETHITLSNDDVLSILTDFLCDRYGPLEELQATVIGQNSDGDFEVTLEPKPAPEPETGK